VFGSARSSCETGRPHHDALERLDGLLDAIFEHVDSDCLWSSIILPSRVA
jgi:hypothetical protein